MLLGNGNGTFAARTDFTAGSVPKAVAIADVNGDGFADVIAANTAGNGESASGIPDGDNVSVLLGNGAGSLGAQTKTTVGPTPFSVAIADLDGDGRRDLATANWHGDDVAVLRNTGATVRDTAAPGVTGTTPATGATGVPAAANVTATFGEPVTAVTAWNVQLFRNGTTTVVPAALTYDVASRTATINPSTDLVAGGTYTAVIRGGPGGIADASGNSLPADHAFGFTVAAGGGDTTPPTVTGNTPADGATGVSATANATVTFSEPMAAATITTGTLTLVRVGTGTPVGAAVTYSAGSQTATLNPSASLVAGAAYTATVSGGAGGVTDVAGIALAADFTWTFTVAGGTPPTTQYLSDLNPTLATNAWGPYERDRSNGEEGAADGVGIRLNGVAYAKGLGTHAASDLRYAIPTGCATFVADLGIDDEVTGTLGGVVFQVYRNTTLLYTSPQLNAASATVPISLDVAAGGTLRLVTTNGNNGAFYDHSDWAGARLTCG